MHKGVYNISRITRFMGEDIKKLKYRPKILTRVLLPLWKKTKSRGKFLLNTYTRTSLVNHKEIKINVCKQKAYIYNKNIFRYQTRDIIHVENNNLLMSKNKDIFFNILQKKVYKKAIRELHNINKLSTLTKKETIKPLRDYSYYARNLVRKWQENDRYIFKRLFALREGLKLFIIYLLSLKGAKTRKYHSRVRYLTQVPIFLKDLKPNILYAFMSELSSRNP